MDDFLRLSAEGFQEVYKQHLEKIENDHKLRMHENRSAVVQLVNLSPYYKENLDPVKVWPFPWEKKPEGKKKKRQSSKERMKALDEKWKPKTPKAQNDE
ncbi:MAG: hypothetical protein JKY55_01035 [Aliivibrio sp.]|uniref:hypothetical protein n=1 Tax=Aliivibrio sp. TaxID=1872443 RepID=UPI001A5502B4|nr:hypothetical protein [Aliivibrio sp.]